MCSSRRPNTRRVSSRRNSIREFGRPRQDSRKFFRPSLLHIQCKRVGQVLFEDFRRMVRRCDAIHPITVDGAQEHLEAFNLVEDAAASARRRLQQLVEKDVQKDRHQQKPRR